MGGWRYPAIKGHARPTFNHISILDVSPSRATLLPRRESNPQSKVFTPSPQPKLLLLPISPRGIPLKVIYTSRYQTRDKSISYLGQEAVCLLSCYGRPMYALSRLAATCPT